MQRNNRVSETLLTCVEKVNFAPAVALLERGTALSLGINKSIKLGRMRIYWIESGFITRLKTF